jgi:hypothetical protein
MFSHLPAHHQCSCKDEERDGNEREALRLLKQLQQCDRRGHLSHRDDGCCRADDERIADGNRQQEQHRENNRHDEGHAAPPSMISSGTARTLSGSPEAVMAACSVVRQVMPRRTKPITTPR